MTPKLTTNIGTITSKQVEINKPEVWRKDFITLYNLLVRLSKYPVHEIDVQFCQSKLHGKVVLL